MSTPALPGPGGRERDPVTSIGVDIGTTNTKVGLLEIADGAGVPRELGIRSFRTPDSPTELGAAILGAIHGLTSRLSRPPVAVGIASMAESGVVLDEAGQPVGPIVRWTAAGASSPLLDAIGTTAREELSLATGVPAVPKVPLATWHHLRVDDPDRWRRLDHWAGMADFVGLVLTGQLATDHTLAGRTLAYRLPPTGRPLGQSFDEDLLGLAGMSAERMPRILRPGEPVGAVGAGAARAAGLAPGTPVYIAGHDHAVAAWAAGMREDGHAADSLGTTEALLRVTASAVDRSAALAAGMSITRTVGGGRECLLAGASGGTVIAQWIAAHPETDVVVLFRALEVGGPGDAFLLPYPRGRQSPYPDATAREALVGRPQSATDSLRAVLVGLCLHLRWMDECQSRILGSSPAVVAVVGGAGAHNAAWNQLKSRLVGTPLTLVAAQEPVASGAALLAAVRFDVAAADATLPSHPIPSHPDPRAQELFDAFVEFATRSAGTKSGPKVGSHDASHA